MLRVPSTEGIVSISLNDSWIGKRFLESFGQSDLYSRGSLDNLNHVRMQQMQTFVHELEFFFKRERKTETQ